MNQPSTICHEPSSPVGLIAGGGRLPFMVAAGARRQGLQVACVGLTGYVDEPLAGEVDAFYHADETVESEA